MRFTEASCDSLPPNTVRRVLRDARTVTGEDERRREDDGVVVVRPWGCSGSITIRRADVADAAWITRTTAAQRSAIGSAQRATYANGVFLGEGERIERGEQVVVTPAGQWGGLQHLFGELQSPLIVGLGAAAQVVPWGMRRTAVVRALRVGLVDRELWNGDLRAVEREHHAAVAHERRHGDHARYVAR